LLPDPDAPAGSPGHPLRAIIIGSGFGGLGMAIALKKQGIAEFAVLERAGDVGGVWRDNGYPGAACDVPSHLYSFSFEPNPDWSNAFARQDEILAYLRRCADRYDVRRHIRFGAEVQAARFDEARDVWTVTLSDGTCLETQVLVNATGQLSQPVTPDLPGRADFAGHSFHSAMWDHAYPLEGKRVAVIGNGASAIQLVPAIADRVRHLAVFQRSASYLYPRGDRTIRPWEKKLYRTLPTLMKLRRLATYLVYESRALGFTRFKWLMKFGLGRPFRRMLQTQVADPALRARLMPDYPIGCKRIVLSDDFLPALGKPNVQLVTDAIRRLTARGVETKDGRLHEADAIIYATGFAATRFLAPMKISGRNGLDLHEVWRDGAAAYLGITVPGFPNFFMIYGPNTNLGHNSIVYMLESQIAHVMRILRELSARHARRVEVDAGRFEAFNKDIRRRLARTVWNGCTSWYVDANGHNSTNWPGFTLTYRWLTRHANLGAYRFSCAARNSAAA